MQELQQPQSSKKSPFQSEAFFFLALLQCNTLNTFPVWQAEYRHTRKNPRGAHRNDLSGHIRAGPECSETGEIPACGCRQGNAWENWSLHTVSLRLQQHDGWDGGNSSYTTVCITRTAAEHARLLFLDYSFGVHGKLLSKLGSWIPPATGSWLKGYKGVVNNILVLGQDNKLILTIQTQTQKNPSPLQTHTIKRTEVEQANSYSYSLLGLQETSGRSWKNRRKQPSRDCTTQGCWGKPDG